MLAKSFEVGMTVYLVTYELTRPIRQLKIIATGERVYATWSNVSCPYLLEPSDYKRCHKTLAEAKRGMLRQAKKSYDQECSYIRKITEAV